PCRRALNERFREREECITVAVGPDRCGEITVELLGYVARELEMLLLIFPHRNMGGAINQNVGGHQGRIGVKADRSILAVLSRLLLELRHSVQPAQSRNAVEYPGKLGMLGNLALIEDDVFF